jgi:hypothetical protein
MARGMEAELIAVDPDVVVALFTPAAERRLRQVLRHHLERNPDTFPYGLLAGLEGLRDAEGFPATMVPSRSEGSANGQDGFERRLEAANPEVAMKLARSRATAIQAYVFLLVVEGLRAQKLPDEVRAVLERPSEQAMARLRSLSPLVLRTALEDALRQLP